MQQWIIVAAGIIHLCSQQLLQSIRQGCPRKYFDQDNYFFPKIARYYHLCPDSLYQPPAKAVLSLMKSCPYKWKIAHWLCCLLDYPCCLLISPEMIIVLAAQLVRKQRQVLFC